MREKEKSKREEIDQVSSNKRAKLTTIQPDSISNQSSNININHDTKKYKSENEDIHICPHVPTSNSLPLARTNQFTFDPIQVISQIEATENSLHETNMLEIERDAENVRHYQEVHSIQTLRKSLLNRSL